MKFGLFLTFTAILSAAAIHPDCPPDQIFKGEFSNGKSTGSTLRVVDWNIDKGVHLEKIIEALRTQEPDVVLLQEVDLDAKRSGGIDVAAVIAKRLGMNYVFAPEFEELGQTVNPDHPALHGQAILSRVPFRNTHVMRFEKQSHFWAPRSYLPKWAFMQRRLGGRIALVAEFEVSGKRVVLYDLHLESRGFGATRTAQLEQVLKDARHYPEGTTIIAGGDLNSMYGPRRARLRFESEGYESCFGDRKVRTHVVFGYLDWLFVKGPSACESARVIRGTHASDHDPLTAQVMVGVVRRSVPRGGL
jgi:endonuclease/exonuclease/phosphatase family metal-dependent hydrolase